MNERNEQLKALMADEAFFNACIEAENEEAVQKLFAEKGVEVSLGEIELMKELVCAVEEGKITDEQLDKLANGGELSEDDLAEAAGGVKPLLDSISEVSDDLSSVDGASTIAGETVYNVAVGGSSLLATAGIIGGAIVTLAATAYGIYRFKSNIASGAKSGYEWAGRQISRRW